MLRLYSFGTAHVSRDGSPLDGAAGQRRLLAILSVLAVHGDAGVSRDKLLALLWPEGDPDRSRHALTQSLYNLRRALQCDDVVLVGPDLRLNPARISSDVAEFDAAVAGHDHECAAQLYTAPFLDGFYIAQSPEFERWATDQRNTRSHRASIVLDALADADERAGSYARAAEWRRRRVVIDPLDSGAVMRLMCTLAAAGEVGAAEQQGRLHTKRLHDELGVTPDAEFQALCRRLRAQGSAAQGRQPAGDATALVDGAAPFPSAPARPAHIATASRVIDAPTATPHPSRRMGARWRWAAAAILPLTAVVVIGLALRPRSAPATASQHLPGARGSAQRLVVAPFRVAAADPSLRYLSEGMVELLAARLGDDSAARAVDPGAVLAAWRDAGMLGAAEVRRDDAIRLARQLGGQLVVTGSVVGGTTHLVLSASVASTATGETVFTERVDGPIDSITTLVDQLATQLLATDAGVSERLSVHRLPPLRAVRAFLSGQAAYRREQYAESVQQFERAIDADSTFALAALRLALAADKLNGAEQHERALDLAWSYRDRLNAADRAHLEAFAGPRYPSPSSESEQLHAWNRAAMLAPDRSEVWQELGERFFFNGAVIGSVDWRARATSALRRSLDLDPSADWSRTLLLLVAARSADTATLRQFATSDGLQDSSLERAPFVRWRVALALGDGAALARSRAVMPQMSASDLRWIALSGMYDAIDAADAERALHILRLRTTRSAELMDVLLAEHSLALNEGLPILALDLTEQLEQLFPASGAHLRLRVLDALYGDGDIEAAKRAVTVMEQSAPTNSLTTPDERAIQLANLCVLEQWRLSHGDRRTVSRTVKQMRDARLARRTLPVSTPTRACADLLDAMDAVATKAPNARTRVKRLDALMLTGPAIGDAVNFAPVVLARMYARLGAPREALDAIRRRPYMSGWPRYLATARREEGLLARRLGEEEAAATVLRRYLALRKGADGPAAASDADIRAFVRSVGPE